MVLRTTTGEVEIANRLKQRQHLGEKPLIQRFLNVSEIVANVLRARRADERSGDVRVRARVFDRQLDDVDPFYLAIVDDQAATLDDRFARRMPSFGSWIPSPRSLSEEIWVERKGMLSFLLIAFGVTFLLEGMTASGCVFDFPGKRTAVQS